MSGNAEGAPPGRRLVTKQSAGIAVHPERRPRSRGTAEAARRFRTDRGLPPATVAGVRREGRQARFSHIAKAKKQTPACLSHVRSARQGLYGEKSACARSAAAKNAAAQGFSSNQGQGGDLTGKSSSLPLKTIQGNECSVPARKLRPELRPERFRPADLSPRSACPERWPAYPARSPAPRWWGSRRLSRGCRRWRSRPPRGSCSFRGRVSRPDSRNLP